MLAFSNVRAVAGESFPYIIFREYFQEKLVTGAKGGKGWLVARGQWRGKHSRRLPHLPELLPCSTCLKGGEKLEI